MFILIVVPSSANVVLEYILYNNGRLHTVEPAALLWHVHWLLRVAGVLENRRLEVVRPYNSGLILI